MTIDTPEKAAVSKQRRKARNARYYKKRSRLDPKSTMAKRLRATAARKARERKRLEEHKKSREYLAEVKERLKDFKPWTL